MTFDMTIKFDTELGITVYYDYQPAEGQTDDYPGCDAEIQNVFIYFGSKDITNELSDEQRDSITQQCMDSEIEE